MVTQRHVVAVDEARGWPAGVAITSTCIVSSIGPKPLPRAAASHPRNLDFRATVSAQQVTRRSRVGG